MTDANSSDVSAISDGSTPLPALIGDRYRTGRELGHGGMARVYLAHDIKHDRDVAVKVIRAELAASLGRERFLREIAIAARLRHPNIVPLYDSGDADGTLFFVMPYEVGQTLRTRLAQEGALPISDVVSVLRDVARALQYAHAQGVVHRDIKPDNVMMSGGAAVVTDFGIAKAVSAAQSEATGGTLTQTGTGIGTPSYMAPEQAVGDPSSDHRADIYSFGCLAYELLSGVPPFHGMQPFQIIAAHVGIAPKPVSGLRAETPPALAVLVMECLLKDPASRPQSAAELLNALDASGATTGPVARSIPRRRRVRFIALAAVGLVVVTTVVLRRPVSGPPPPLTIGVLPIANISGDTSIGVFADGLGDEVFTALGRVPGLQMRSRSGARNYHGKLGVDAKEVGRALHVDYIVTGAMRQATGRLIISAELTRTDDGAELWTQTFDRTPEQQLGVAAEIANAALSELRRRFPGAIKSAPVRSANQQTKNTEAYRLYVLGQELLRRRGQSVTEGAEAFRQAIRLDPNYAGAHAGLAMSLALYPYFAGVSAHDVAKDVFASASTAMRIDSTLSQPHVALGLAYEHDYQWERSEKEFRTALKLDPDDVEAHVQLGRHLQFTGHLDDALTQFQLARLSDPASALVLSWTSYTYFLLGQLDSARVILSQARQSGASNLTTLALGSEVLLGTGAKDSAIAQARRMDMGVVNPTIEFVLAAAGDTTTAWLRLRAGEARTPPPALIHTSRALLLLGVRDTAGALTALEAATDARELWPAFQPCAGPIFNGVRGSARFLALLARVGLPPSAARAAIVRSTGR